MAFPNPTINPPTFSRPDAATHRRVHSRSHSRSPVRHARDYDPLLRDLSPSTTLRAFSDEHLANHDGAHRALAHSFAAASSSERAFGAKAARACLDLRSWVRELASWQWPGTFDTPNSAQEGMRDGHMNGEDRLLEEYSGSLPSGMVQDYERRMDEIARERDALDLEDMKRFVLSAHGRTYNDSNNTWFARNSVNVSARDPDLRHLDDFTALITATILQALPYLSSLNRLLDVWTIRLLVCRQASAFLADLARAREDLKQGWATIAMPSSCGSFAKQEILTWERMEDIRGVIERQVNSLGRRLDNFLDQLEGRKETVPDAWIDEFEKLESAYGEWVVQAERKVLEDEWREARVNENHDSRLAHTINTQNHRLDVSRSPIRENDCHDHNSGSSTTSRPVSSINDEVAEPFLDSAFQQRFVPDLDSHDLHMPREVPQTLPADQGEQIQHNDGDDERTTMGSPTRPGLLHSPSRRSRHVPIIINYEDPSEIHPVASNDEGDGQVIIPDLPAPVQSHDATSSPMSNVAKKRAAFANGDLERATSLQRQVKSPVRPFEHASNAFTRLFRKEKTPEVGRTSSHRSTLSAQSNDDKRFKNDGNVIWGGRKPESPVASPPTSTNPREDTSRSRSASYRSQARSENYAGATVDTIPITVPRRTRKLSREASYLDMPGGFRPRSRSTSDSQKIRSRVSLGRGESYTSQERRLERMKPETYQPTRSMVSSARRPSSASVVKVLAMRREEGEEKWPADWPLASPTNTGGANSPDKNDERSGSPTNGRVPAVEHANDDGNDDLPSSPEISSPKVAMDTDAFDRFFVESFPATPETQPVQPQRGGIDTVVMRHERSIVATKRTAVPTVDEEMLGMGHDGPDMFDLGVPSPGHGEEGDGVQDGSDFHRGGDANETQFGFDFDQAPRLDGDGVDAGLELHSMSRSIPGIEELQRAGEQQPLLGSTGYFPLLPAGNTMLSEARDDHQTGTARSISPTSPHLKLHIPDLHTQLKAEPNADTEDAEIMEGKPILMHRASVASIESHPRSALRSIDLTPRRTSQLFTWASGSGIGVVGPRSLPHTPREPISAVENSSMPTSPLPYSGSVISPSPPVQEVIGDSKPVSRSRSPVSPMGSRDQSPAKIALHNGSPPFPYVNGEREKVPSDSPMSISRSASISPAAPPQLNAAMAKRQDKRKELSTPIARHRKAGSRDGPPLAPGEDTFDRHVSEVLDRLPSNAIKFRSRPGGTKTFDSTTKRTPDPRRPKAAIGRISSRGTPGSLTLAPADPSPKRSADETKLYHLTQAGRDEPIKLFVRLVGEGERVMVRVGGGWADLADYLRQYAEHHGSRTVSSSGGIELLNAADKAGPGSRKVSTSTTIPSTMATPEQSRFSMGCDAESSGDEAGTETTTPHAFAITTNPSTTPKSSSSKSFSRPSTANSGGGRPSSRQTGDWPLGNSNGNNFGLDASKDLPELKARWVEGMLEKAKVASSASAEKKKENGGKAGGKFWGELGKVGGTRRIVFKEGSSAGVGGTGTTSGKHGAEYM
ncbi:hypothetical protein LTR62_004482 [Meristemomyces frigidus]|uniref:GAR domain-containing protein n=1 Tax=Meristemomyces frigidus TaxID=1508187 RepID=A0AAN7TFH3_9PEZI|nr:hypothetical protein LTR62_004482 [Meristemomyces frigidus]